MATATKAIRATNKAKKRARPAVAPEVEAISFSLLHDNVFKAMGLPDAAERLVKAEMVREIRLLVEAKGWTQKRAATELKIAASDVSDLFRGKLRRFSQERLGRFLNTLDMDVRIQIGPCPAWKTRAGVTVERVASF